MKIYFVRHGETESNKKKIHQGAEDSLSEIGLWQAKQVAYRFKDIHIEALVSSSYRRAKQTAQAINKHTKLSIEYWNELIAPVKPKELVGKHKEDPEGKKIKKQIKDHLLDAVWHFNDEENMFDFYQRVVKVMSKLAQRKEASLAVVTHSEVLRVITQLIVTGEDITKQKIKMFKSLKDSLRHTNSGITVCEHHDGVWSLHTWNDDAHLG